MDSLFSGKLDDILSDKETMQKLRDIADSLGQKNKEQSPPPSEMPPSPQTPSKVGGYCALLSAIRPYLDDERRLRADKIIRALKMTETAKNLIGF